MRTSLIKAQVDVKCDMETINKSKTDHVAVENRYIVTISTPTLTLTIHLLELLHLAPTKTSQDQLIQPHTHPEHNGGILPQRAVENSPSTPSPIESIKPTPNHVFLAILPQPPSAHALVHRRRPRSVRGFRPHGFGSDRAISGLDGDGGRPQETAAGAYGGPEGEVKGGWRFLPKEGRTFRTRQTMACPLSYPYLHSDEL
jgi:hypothetical protein